jgi:hypothetical protein
MTFAGEDSSSGIPSQSGECIVYIVFTVYRQGGLSSEFFASRIPVMPPPKVASALRTTLSFRVPAEQLVEIDEEILKDHRKSRSDLVEPIWDWAWKEYKKAGSLRALLGISRPRARSARISEETQEQLYTALETILERAPSAVIEDVARMLTARAGKYGEPRSRR